MELKDIFEYGLISLLLLSNVFMAVLIFKTIGYRP